ncbi:hypothetical protein PAXRUDRAFT_17282 [Paxillus rubicundulus Ve08.2h10]|uniref:Uncharacterized protein n=1 Tax=Paxillus rubicundulus Ve08.2h10 TaxID=930991 RepID=A0A0D0DI45_9AGAM|nr:hypothetical protein PAXRUDRAFT_17282 [Paxillus rubicundulus Ve08.2h10]
MSSSIANDLTKWNDEQLRENEDNDDELFKKKSAEHRHCTKVRKEVERQMAEEVVRWKAEEEAKQKAEVEVQRRAEAEAKVCTEEVAQAQSSVSGPLKGKQLKVAVSGTAEVAESVGGITLCYGCSDAGVACEGGRGQQGEVVLGTLEEIWGCVDLEFTPEELEEGSEEDFEEEEVVEAAEEREALKGWNEEEAEVDESV